MADARILFVMAMFAVLHTTQAWNDSTLNVYFPFDLEATPLQIRTDSAVDSDEEVAVELYTSDRTQVSSLYLKFGSTPQYFIYYCTSDYTNFPTALRDEQDKVWTLTKGDSALTIHCNDVEVLNLLYTDGVFEGSSAQCEEYMGMDVEQIKFNFYYDTASDAYREQPAATCTRPNIEHGEVGPNDATIDEGDSYQIKCDNGYSLTGDDDMECQSDGTLTNNGTSYCVADSATCTRPNIEHGEVGPDDATIDEGDSYQITCGNGYSLTGDDDMECQSNGTLTNNGTSYCVADSATCTRPNVEHGEVGPDDAMIDEGDSYKIRCDNGYSLTGDDDMECQSDGTLTNDGTSYCVADSMEDCDWDGAWGAYKCYVGGATTSTATITVITTVAALLY